MKRRKYYHIISPDRKLPSILTQPITLNFNLSLILPSKWNTITLIRLAKDNSKHFWHNKNETTQDLSLIAFAISIRKGIGFKVYRLI